MDTNRHRMDGGFNGNMSRFPLSPRPLTQRQLGLLQRFAQSSLQMTPHEFLLKWDVNQRQLALITGRSLSAVKKWFQQGGNFRSAGKYSCLRLGLADWLLQTSPQISESDLSRLFRDNP